MTYALNCVSLALCALCFVFFLIGCVGYGSDSSSPETVPWIISDDDNFDLYFGLQTILVTFESPSFSGTFSYTLDYTDSNCTPDFCNDCETDGKAAFGLTLIALVFTTFSLGVLVALLIKYSRTLQIANIFMAAIAASASLIGIGLFMGDCYNAINDENVADDTYGGSGYTADVNLQWGSGSIITLVGMLLMWFVTILQIIASVLGMGESGQANNNAV